MTDWKEEDLSFAEAIEWVSEGQSVEGRATRIEEAGNLGSRILTLRTPKGESVSVWETVQLQKLFNDLARDLAAGIEVDVKLIYQGKKKLRSGREGHDFKAFTRRHTNDVPF